MEDPRDDVVGSVLVVGAGIAGIQAALDLAESGFFVHLVEEQSAIGGSMAQLDKTFPTNDCAMCIISPKLVEAGRHRNIRLHTLCRVGSVSGRAGRFRVGLRHRPRFVDLAKCTACGECAKVCPIEVRSDYDEGLSVRKAAYKLYPQGMPGAYAIEKRGTAPCKATCPAHVSVQGYIALVNQGRYREGLELFREEHPFPGVCGRVCHHPCEGECTRGAVDEALAIRELHRFLFDWERAAGDLAVPPAAEARPEKVAVIGSGPAGLSAAYFLARRGYRVTVFEKLPVAGGMMAVGIPAYRLPREVLEREIELIRRLGVEIRTGVALGREVSFESLKAEGYGAVFVAVGLHGGRRLGVENEDAAGVLQGVDFLRRVSLGEKVEIGREVLVVGGGNVAVDVALTAKRLGAPSVTMVCLERREEMPAWAHEIQEALESDIRIVNSFGPKAFFIDASRRVSGIEFKSCTAVFDENGRFNPSFDESACQAMFADTVILAIGQTLERGGLAEAGVPLRGPGLEADPVTLQTPLGWVFAGGDALYGPKSVVEAVACGKEAAESIHRYLNGQDLRAGRPRRWEGVRPERLEEPRRRRVPVRCLEPAARACNFLEVSYGYDEAEARAEASRCLRCGICSECYQCVKACLARAVDHGQTETESEIEVGAIVLAPGFEPYDPSAKETTAYRGHPNVVTSLEFERILSATGPTQGHLQRLSDGREPKRIAWLQCIGSRGLEPEDRRYCSSVCCMYAVKQAVIAKEHSHDPLETVIFYIDLRTFGKDFDRYALRASEEHGVRFERARVHSVIPRSDGALRLRYVRETGALLEEDFDLVVLSVGLCPSRGTASLAAGCGIPLNEQGFAATRDLAPISAGREGIFVCGAFPGPKDIPQAVMEGSAAAAAASALLASARHSCARERALPPETDVSGEPPRIGVFICHCGINIGGVADVPAVRDFASRLPDVVHVEDNLFTCSQDTQERMKQVIREKRINRLVVASCSPRTHEPLFQETLRDAGLNPFLFEMANIRDQNTWVHMNDPERATAKAKDLVRMAVAKARWLEPLHPVDLPVRKAALVVGGGIAGLEVARGLSRQGIEVALVEQATELGGNARRLHTTWRGEPVAAYLKDLIREVESDPRVRIYCSSRIRRTGGSVGQFQTAWGLLNGNGAEVEFEHGVTVLAVGGREYRPREFGYGTSPRILTQLEFDEARAAGDPRLAAIACAVFIQCVGSRTPERPGCSRVCCTHSLKTAIALKRENPSRNLFVLYRDLRAYGFREVLYEEARRLGVHFVRYDPLDPPRVETETDGRLRITVRDPVLDRPLRLRPDVAVLAAAILPQENRELFELFKVPVNSEGFLVEAHAKLRPVDFASEGIFVAGLAHSPKPIEETILQAQAAVSRAMTLLSRDVIRVGGAVAEVEGSRCAVCLTCVRACPYGVPRIAPEKGHAVIPPAACHGCGICVSECPGKAITLRHHTDRQILAKAAACFATAAEGGRP